MGQDFLDMQLVLPGPGSGTWKILPHKIDLLFFSFDIKVNIIDILVFYYYFGLKVQKEKFNFEYILYLNVQTGSRSDQNTRIRIRNPWREYGLSWYNSIISNALNRSKKWNFSLLAHLIRSYYKVSQASSYWISGVFSNR